jgi:hypothetical protein
MAEFDVGTAYCVPIDISGQEIENVAIATTLGDAADPVANGMIRLVLNFTAFTIMLIAIVFGAPYIHDIAVYNFIADPAIAAAAGAGAAPNYDTIKNKINTFHYVYFFLFCIIAIFFIINSFAAGVASQMIIGIFMLLFIIIFSGRIYLHIESIISAPRAPGQVNHKYSTYTANITGPDLNFNSLNVNGYFNGNLNWFIALIILVCCFILVFGLIIFLVPGYTSEVKWPYFMLCIPVFIYLSYIFLKYF